MYSERCELTQDEYLNRRMNLLKLSFLHPGWALYLEAIFLISYWYFNFLRIPLAILMLIVFSLLFIKRLVRKTLSMRFNDSYFIKKSLQFNITENSIGYSNEDGKMKTSWDNLKVYAINGDDVGLLVEKIGSIFLSRSEMEREGVYPEILQLCKQNGYNILSLEGIAESKRWWKKERLP